MSREALSPQRSREMIDRIIAERGAELVAIYYRDVKFAGHLFDSLGENPTDRFTTDDMLAASLLDVRFGPPAVRALLCDDSINETLGQIDRDVPIWGDIDLGDKSPAQELWTQLTSIPGIGGTRASKLMARKRPNLFPILDSVVRERLGAGHIDAWTAIRRVLDDERLRARIDGLWTAPEADRPSTLRLLDVATWMRYSKSRNAHTARETLGLAD